MQQYSLLTQCNHTSRADGVWPTIRAACTLQPGGEQTTAYRTPAQACVAGCSWLASFNSPHAILPACCILWPALPGSRLSADSLSCVEHLGTLNGYHAAASGLPMDHMLIPSQAMTTDQQMAMPLLAHLTS